MMDTDLQLLEPKSDLVRKLEAMFHDPVFAQVPDATFNVTDHGAEGDGSVINTRAIQDCIDAAAAAGGGVVCVPQGVFLSGSLFLKSNVELRLSEGATIRAIQDDNHYPEIWSRIAGVEMEWPAALINIYKQENVRITGKGTIDGNGKYWWDKFWGDPPLSGGMYRDYIDRGLRWAVDYDCKRVRGVLVHEARNVLIKDITVMRSGFWTVTMTYCELAHVDGVIVRNNVDGFGPSSDGINTDSSSDILVENCDIDCNDDNLCIKSGKDADGLRVNRPAENIVYRNCVTRSGHGLFTLGSETSGGMRNIEVYGLKAVGTTMGLRFKSAKVRGGIMENISFHHIEMDSVKYPFHFELNWYPEYSYATIPKNIPKDSVPQRWKALTAPVVPPERGIPEFREICFSEIVVKNAGQAFFVNAYPEKPMRNVHWKNVSIEAEEPGEINHALDWSMDKVTLRVRGPDLISMTNAKDVEAPNYIHDGMISSKEPDILVDLDLLLSGTEEAEPAGIIAIAENGRLIRAGDTFFSEKITVLILPERINVFQFFEPWGDGVVTSPVDIRLHSPGHQIIVSGQRAHHWTVYWKLAEHPSDVQGADHWEFDAEREWLMFKKIGSAFTVGINGKTN